jgi:hypothetical protein
LNEVLNQATRKIANLIQKSFNKTAGSSGYNPTMLDMNQQQRMGKTAEDLENLIKQADFD